MKKYFPPLQYINVPNIITTAGLIFIFLAYFSISVENLKWVYIYLFIAASLDLLDGFFANKLNQRTLFGKHLDTLTDFFSCCILPVLTVFAFVGSSPLILVFCVFYCICGLWRLANYNISQAGQDYFTGLPVPAAMAFVMLANWCVVMYSLPAWVCMAVCLVTALFMISGIKLAKYALWQKVLGVAAVAFMILVILS